MKLADKFPQLEILELLGQGGMGAVYKARQTNLDRLVALKIIRPGATHDPAFAERFNREAKTLARLGHQHIVAVYDFGEVDFTDSADGQTQPLYFFIMEYVDGANLRQLIQAGQLAPEQALAIVPQICDALQFAHDEGVVHRDIKPENILLDKQGRVKIADFGLAKLATRSPEELSLTGTHQVMGTLRYMAPEQMEGSHAVDHRADIYSLGVVFYEMLTCQVPAGHFDPPSKKVEIDVRLDEVVLRAMAREPERRYQQASEVKTEVETIASTFAPPVRGQTSEPLSPFLALFWDWPHPGKKYFGGLAIIVVSLAVGILLLQSEVSGVPFLEWMSFAFLLGAIGSVYASIPYRRWADGQSGRGIQLIRVFWGMGLLFLAGGSTSFIRNVSALLDVTEWYALTGSRPGESDMRAGGLFTLVTFAWTMLFFMRARQPFRGLEKPNRWTARQWNIGLAIWIGALVFIGGAGGFKIYFPRFVQERTASGANMEDIEKAAALTQEGWGLMNAQKWTPAQKAFEAALELDPEASNALSGQGFILLNTGKAKEAKPYFERCLAVEPLHMGALNGLARCAKEGEGNVAEAIAIWEKMAKEIPGAHTGVYFLAWTYLEQEEYAKAIPYFEQMVKAKPGDQEAKVGLERAKKGLER